VRHPLSKGGCGFVVVGPTRRMVYLGLTGPRRGAVLVSLMLIWSPKLYEGEIRPVVEFCDHKSRRHRQRASAHFREAHASPNPVISCRGELQRRSNGRRELPLCKFRDDRKFRQVRSKDIDCAHIFKNISDGYESHYPDTDYLCWRMLTLAVARAAVVLPHSSTTTTVRY
jgi:hypothetical protein